MTTYTVLSAQGEVLFTGLSLRDAAFEMLTSDGRDFEIREENGMFFLWARQECAGRPWHRMLFVSASDDRAEAEDEIFRDVIEHYPMPGYYQVIEEGGEA